MQIAPKPGRRSGRYWAVMDKRLVEKFFAEGKAFLGVEYPFICGAMTWVSGPQLVAAVANAGGFACLAGGNASPDALEDQIRQTRRLTDKPFGVNLIAMAPAYQEQLARVRNLQCPFVVYAGLPRRRDLACVQEGGAKTLCFAPTRMVARRMLKNGADALIVEGMEGGGHVGEVSLTVLLQQILFSDPGVPVFAGGGIAAGRMCAHLFLMGAAGVQMGTRFAVAAESRAHPEFKQRYIKARAREAVVSRSIDRRLPVIAVRALRNRSTEDFNRLQVQLLQALETGELSRDEVHQRLEGFWENRLHDAVIDGDFHHGSMMAGQSVGLVNREQPAEEIIRELVTDTAEELERVRQKLGTLSAEAGISQSGPGA
ncbi:MAG TPA: nitronate monooxygenase [Desulfosalsimonadaceae bacterium]|nr:nitronate monooxygenase [Desulfosalsimonadaceae bacterium]